MAEKQPDAFRVASDRQRRGLLGPLLLILVGIALLLNQLDIWVVDWSRLWRLWPLVLVFAGLDIILSRTRLGGLVFLVLAVAAVGALVFFLASPGEPGADYRRKTFSYPLEGVEAAVVRLDPGAARLEILPARTSRQLVELEASYDASRAHANIVEEVSLSGDVATVRLRGEGDAIQWLGSPPPQQWRVWLSPEVPLRLEIDAGVGSTRLDLEDLSLTRLDLSAGVGSVWVALAGQGDYEAFVNVGVGSLIIEIPEMIEASIRVDKGLGSVNVGGRYLLRGRYYITEGYESARSKVDLDIDGGIGSITIR